MYTNCQRGLIFEFLKLSDKFMQKYRVDLDEIPPNHIAIRDRFVIPEQILEKTKLFIYQPLDSKHGHCSTEYILEKLPSDCISISLPRLYFKGYWPQHAVNPYNQAKPEILYDLFPYGDHNLNQMLKQKLPKSKILNEVSRRDIYDSKLLLNNIKQNLAESKKRETATDVKIADYIHANYQNKQLFHTINHPTDIIGLEVANQILRILNMSPLPESTKPLTREALGGIQVPIYPSVIEQLNLTFVSINSLYRSKGLGKMVTFSEYVEEYLYQDFEYDRASELTSHLSNQQSNIQQKQLRYLQLKTMTTDQSQKQETATKPTKTTDINLSRGVIYIVTGANKYFEEFIFSATSLKNHCPDIPITIFTDNSEFKANCFDKKVLISNSLQPLQTKCKYLYQSPYEHSLFLDTDTQILQPIYEIFDWLKEYDICVANGPMWDRNNPQKLQAYAAPNNYNTGVIGYRKSAATQRFFELWIERMLSQELGDKNYYQNSNVNDQFFFNQLMFNKIDRQLKLNIKIMPNTVYNVRCNMLYPLIQDGKLNYIKLIHMHNLHKKNIQLRK